LNQTINTTIKTATPNIDVQVQTLPDLNDLIKFKDDIISSINKFLGVFPPDYSIYVVLVISAVIALLLKKKYDEDWIWFSIVTTVIYLAFRALKIGG